MAGAARFERAIDMTQAEREMVLHASCPGYAEQHFRNVPHALRGNKGSSALRIRVRHVMVSTAGGATPFRAIGRSPTYPRPAPRP